MNKSKYEMPIQCGYVKPGTIKDYIKNNKPNGYLSLCNCFGLLVWIKNSDECIAAYCNGLSYSGINTHSIYYSIKGDPYIKKMNKRYYLKDFIRI